MPVAATEGLNCIRARAEGGPPASVPRVAERHALGGTRHAARRLGLRLAAPGEPRHAIAHEEHEVERRRGDADTRLHAPAPGELTGRPDGHAAPILRRRGARRRRPGSIRRMEGLAASFNDPDFQKRLQEMAEQMQARQSLAWADNAIKLAVDMTVAAINRVNIQGTTEQQAQQIRAVMATVFPEAVTLVREARQGLS